MSETAILRTRFDTPQDMSEVWSPSEEDGLEFLRRNNRPGCYPKHIIIQNRIGYMIMPGIYYFGKCTSECSVEAKIAPIPCSRKIAMITDCRSSLRNLLYLAVDEANIDYLYELQNILGDRLYSVIVNEPPVVDEAQKEAEELFVSSACAEMTKAFADIFENNSRLSDISSNPSKESTVESTAEELMPGLGICDICISLKCIHRPRISMIRYKYAYKSGDKLVLINDDEFDFFTSHWEESARNKRQEYDLHTVEELMVCRKEVLHCGLPIDRFYPIISCTKEF